MGLLILLFFIFQSNSAKEIKLTSTTNPPNAPDMMVSISTILPISGVATQWDFGRVYSIPFNADRKKPAQFGFYRQRGMNSMTLIITLDGSEEKKMLELHMRENFNLYKDMIINDKVFQVHAYYQCNKACQDNRGIPDFSEMLGPAWYLPTIEFFVKTWQIFLDILYFMICIAPFTDEAKVIYVLTGVMLILVLLNKCSKIKPKIPNRDCRLLSTTNYTFDTDRRVSCTSL